MSAYREILLSVDTLRRSVKPDVLLGRVSVTV